MSSPIPLQSLRCVFQTFFFFTFSLLNCYDTGWISLIFALWTIMALVESAYWKLQNGSEGSSLLFFSWSKWVRNTADSYNNILPKLKIITPRFQIAFFYNSSYFPPKKCSSKWGSSHSLFKPSNPFFYQCLSLFSQNLRKVSHQNPWKLINCNLFLFFSSFEEPFWHSFKYALYFSHEWYDSTFHHKFRLKVAQICS